MGRADRRRVLPRPLHHQAQGPHTEEEEQEQGERKAGRAPGVVAQ